MKNTSKRAQEFCPEIGQRVSDYYRRRYPKHTAKRLAQEAGCEISTAKGWLSGRCPATEHLMQMWARRGHEFFAFVFAPMDEKLATIADMQAEIEAIKKRIHRVAEALEENDSEG